MRNYELITIFNTAGGVTLDAARQGVQDIFAAHNIKSEKEDDWGERRLHHDVERVANGHFVLWTLKGPPDQMKELARELQIHQGVLRYMIRRA